MLFSFGTIEVIVMLEPFKQVSPSIHYPTPKPIESIKGGIRVNGYKVSRRKDNEP